MTININGKHGAKIGNIQVFTYEGAIEAFKTFVKICYKNITLESAVVLADVSLDMYNLGFTPGELEDIEIETIRAA